MDQILLSHSNFLRKAVRQADSLLCATEGRIGGLGGRASFLALKSRSPLGEMVYREGGFAGLCTVLQFGDGGYRFPPGPSDGVIGTSHKNIGNMKKNSGKIQ